MVAPIICKQALVYRLCVFSIKILQSVLRPIDRKTQTTLLKYFFNFCFKFGSSAFYLKCITASRKFHKSLFRSALIKFARCRQIFPETSKKTLFVLHLPNSPIIPECRDPHLLSAPSQLSGRWRHSTVGSRYIPGSKPTFVSPAIWPASTGPVQWWGYCWSGWQDKNRRRCYVYQPCFTKRGWIDSPLPLFCASADHFLWSFTPPFRNRTQLRGGRGWMCNKFLQLQKQFHLRQHRRRVQLPMPGGLQVRHKH